MKLGKSKDGREMHYSAGVIVECNSKYLMLDRKILHPVLLVLQGILMKVKDQKLLLFGKFLKKQELN